MNKQKVGLLRYIDNWFFGLGSPATLGLFRIVICSLAFLNLAMIAIDFEAWYGDKGYVPLEISRQYAAEFMTHIGSYELPFAIPRINFLAGVESTEVVAIAYSIIMAAALLSIVGLWTRVSTIVLALGMITLHHRNLLILHGGDTALRQFVIIVALAPSGAAISLDRFIAVWKGKAPAEPPPVALWGQRLIQVQIALLYFTAVWWKWQGSHWRDGTATHYIHNLREFDRFWVPDFLAQQPFIALTTYGTLVTELALATLVFYRPFRKWVLIAGLAMHGYIEYRFNIPMFAYITTSSYICFYEGHEVSAWARRLGERFKRARLRVFLPAGMRLEGAKGDAIRNMDPLGLVEYEAGTGETFCAETASGKKRNPFLATWERSFGAWPLVLVWDKLLRRAVTPGRRDGAATPVAERVAGQ